MIGPIEYWGPRKKEPKSRLPVGCMAWGKSSIQVTVMTSRPETTVRPDVAGQAEATDRADFPVVAPTCVAAPSPKLGPLFIPIYSLRG